MQTRHNQILIGLLFSRNIFQWSKFKARSHDIFFIDLLLIFFWYLVFGVYFSPRHRNIVCETNFIGIQSWNKNKHIHFFLISKKKPVFNVKLWINFNFTQFHEHVFRSTRSQMFFKIGALKNFAILRIKKRQTPAHAFSCKKQPLEGVLFSKLMLTYW